MSLFQIAWLEDRPAADLALARSLLPGDFAIEPAPLSASGEASPESAACLTQAEALLVQHAPVSEHVLNQAPRARLVQLYGVRDEWIDRKAAKRRGVEVAIMPLRGCIAVAELGMTLILALSKQLITAHGDTTSGAYRRLALTPTATDQARFAFQWMKLGGVFELNGTTLGIVGLGEIGTEMARRARAFGMDVVYNKRVRLPEQTESMLGVGWADFDALLAKSDFVALTLPYSKAVHHLIGARELGLMRSSSFLVNLARGPLVDECALAQGLADRRIAGAGLDVFEQEPLPFDSPLAQSPHVILTPHIGGGSGGAREKQLGDVLHNIVSFARTGEARYTGSTF